VPLGRCSERTRLFKVYCSTSSRVPPDAAYASALLLANSGFHSAPMMSKTPWQGQDEP